MTLRLSFPTCALTRFKRTLSALSHARGGALPLAGDGCQVGLRRRVRAVAAREENQHDHT